MSQALKDAVRQYWDARPCGTGDVRGVAEGTPEFFRALDARRYALEPFVERHAEFGRHAGQRVLEIGCGVGADLCRFAGAGAVVTGLDMSGRSLGLTRRRFELAGLKVNLSLADAEALPFRDARFDFVYSWGVLHHTPKTGRAVAEARRVLVPGGRVCVMLYHRHSLYAVQAWLRFALLRGRPRLGLSDVLAANVESPGTRAYTVAEATRLFQDAGFVEVTCQTVLTRWDARIGRRRFLPSWCAGLLPDRWGWFLVVRARRAAG